MNKYAQITNNRVHWVFESEHTLEVLYDRYYNRDSISLVDITGQNVEEGMSATLIDGQWGFGAYEPTIEEIQVEVEHLLEAKNRKDRLKQTAETAPFDDAILIKIGQAGYFDPWQPNQIYGKGKRLEHNDGYYELGVDVAQSLENQQPGMPGMTTVYRPIDASGAAGTLGDPITFILGMDVYNRKYYSYNNNVYLAKAAMPACVWPPNTPGMWQWEEI